MAPWKALMMCEKFVSFSVILKFGANGDPIRVGRADLIQMPSHIISAFQGAIARAWGSDDVVHVIARRRIRLAIVDRSAAQLRADRPGIGNCCVDDPVRA